MSRRRAWMVLALLIGSGISGTVLAESDAKLTEFSLQGVWTGIDPATGRDGSTFAMTVHVGAEKVRIDLPGARGARMLVDRHTGEGWAFDPAGTAGIPIKADVVESLLVDPSVPCRRLGVTCHEVLPKVIAGVTATGWRFAGAGRRGPGGSHAGTMWVEPETGIILGYEARTRDRQARRMRAVSIEVAPVSEALLELPEGASP